MHKDFFKAVKESLDKKGIDALIQVLKADGGTMNLDASIEFPAQTVLSGPAASVVGSIPHAEENKDTLVLDIGGTTTDIAILINKTPILEPVGIRRGIYKSLIRSLKTYSKGIGGDSFVKVHKGNLIIGPERRGSAMAFGGSDPTPTDAIVYLDMMNSGDRKLAEKGVRLQILRSADNVDMNSINKSIDEMGVIQTNMLKNKEQHFQSVRDLLTDDQKVYFNNFNRGSAKGQGFGYGNGYGRGRSSGRCIRGW